ncbi:hypothetical protein C2770_09355 [Pasteurella multocida]|nr:hypothetical protein [Pasteurella multocida]QGV29887.1 hypothetical protein EEX22_09760 [Pasteurella multocida]
MTTTKTRIMLITTKKNAQTSAPYKHEMRGNCLVEVYFFAYFLLYKQKKVGLVNEFLTKK